LTEDVKKEINLVVTGDSGSPEENMVGPDTFAALHRGQPPVPPAAGENRPAPGSPAATPQQAASPPAGTTALRR
jgi:hypothetical protein